MPQNFDNLLKERKLNVLQVSKLTGIANSTLYYWKQGKVPLTSAKLEIIADKLNVSVDYLLDKTDNPTPISATTDAEQNKANSLFSSLDINRKTSAILLLEKLQTLNDNDINDLVRYCEFLQFKHFEKRVD